MIEFKDHGGGVCTVGEVDQLEKLSSDISKAFSDAGVFIFSRQPSSRKFIVALIWYVANTGQVDLAIRLFNTCCVSQWGWSVKWDDML